MSETRSGHCLCGAVHYTVPYPFDGEIAHCHCTQCRRQAGSVALTWFTVPRDGLILSGDPIKRYKSSETGERGFCGTCGTPIAFWNSKHPDLVDVTLCSLDEDQIEPATLHIHVESHLPWLDLDSNLPKRSSDY